MRITASPDTVNSGPGSELSLAGTGWLQSIAQQLPSLLLNPPRILTIDMGGVNFASLFEWITFVSMMERLLTTQLVNEIALDFASDTSRALLSPKEWLDFRDGRANIRMVRKRDFDYSTRLFELVGYLESLDTRQMLNRPHRMGSVHYAQFGTEQADFKAFYTRNDRETRVLNLNRVESKEDCKQFLDEARIIHWKNEMHRRFRNSPLFEFEEVWRIFFHELAVNIWEHAQVAGFMAGRVVFPLQNDRRPKPWCIRSYGSPIADNFDKMADGFLELCAADYGRGLAETLQQAFLRHTGDRDSRAIPAEDLLAFAFDEFGTCKNANDSWATERHALGRILLLVAKYGGILTARSGGVEVVYVTYKEGLIRLPNHLGYKPQITRERPSSLLGTQLQLILPLTPILPHDGGTRRQRWMSMQLPDSFRVDSSHVRGHLVPLLEELDFAQPATGTPERRLFRAASEKLCRRLIRKRPSEEPLVLDFNGLQWSPQQFETLLHLLHNLLQNRPALLVELDPKLASQIETLEDLDSATQLDIESVATSPGSAGHSYSEFSESRFLDTFRRVHCTLLAIDRDQRPYIFGLPHTTDVREYANALLSLIETPQSVDQLLKRYTLRGNVLCAILNSINPLFCCNGGQWKCVWDGRAIKNEATRVLSRHFDDVIAVCEAKWGRPHPRPARKSKHQLTLQLPDKHGTLPRFALPWQEDAEWAQEFIECSRILSRGRYADEAAQRLLYRLRKGLEREGRSLKSVRVLACVTAPSMLLAAAMHRWWPDDAQMEPPSIADMGYYLMLHPEQHPPKIPGEGGVVIVQDLLSKGIMSARLITLLKSQGKSILALIAMVRLVPGLKCTRATSITDWYSEPQDGVPRHAMIEVRRPGTCEGSAACGDDANSYWVEPRTLRPIPLRQLRGEAGTPPSGESPVLVQSQLYEGGDRCLVRAGHYVYGSRHYCISIDTHQAFHGELGDRLAHWIADLCEGAKGREKAAWETARGFSEFRGDVSAVLLPLHSQIHYLWPKVDNLLAQRGRRQHMWLLDATLFLGRGPAYRLPRQFEQQLQLAFEEAVLPTKDANAAKSLRILVLDDAIATSRTALTILDTIKRALKEAAAKIDLPLQNDIAPIEWIRYFAVFNQIGFAQSRHWHDMHELGVNARIKFIFEEYAQCMGFAIYEDGACPYCRDLDRVSHLRSIAERDGIEEVRHWAEVRSQELQPIAIDSAPFSGAPAMRLKNPIVVLSQRVLGQELAQQFQACHADAAIAIFHELMYRSYPPNDVLDALKEAYPSNAEPFADREFGRYRWAVLEWCIRNWCRIEACGSRTDCLNAIRAEIDRNTDNVERIFEGIAQLYTDSRVLQFFLNAVDTLAEMEKARGLEEPTGERSHRRIRLYRSLLIFMLNVGQESLSSTIVGSTRRKETVLAYIGRKATALKTGKSTFLRQLFLRFTRPQRLPTPSWALNTISEALFRGRDPEKPAAARHQLLPLLLKQVSEDPQNAERRQLLQGSLSLFLAALEDLTPYLYGTTLTNKDNIIKNGRIVLDWLKHPPGSDTAKQKPSALAYLSDYLAINEDFCQCLNNIYHKRVADIVLYCQKHRDALSQELSERISFEFTGKEDALQSRLLTQVDHLCLALCNWTIDPIRDYSGVHKSRIVVSTMRQMTGAYRICFTLLTSFAGPVKTNESIKHGRCAHLDRDTLELFGVEMEDWTTPAKVESDEGYRASCRVLAPAGFVRKGSYAT